MREKMRYCWLLSALPLLSCAEMATCASFLTWPATQIQRQLARFVCAFALYFIGFGLALHCHFSREKGSWFAANFQGLARGPFASVSCGVATGGQAILLILPKGYHFAETAPLPRLPFPIPSPFLLLSSSTLEAPSQFTQRPSPALTRPHFPRCPPPYQAQSLPSLAC